MSHDTIKEKENKKVSVLLSHGVAQPFSFSVYSRSAEGAGSSGELTFSLFFFTHHACQLYFILCTINEYFFVFTAFYSCFTISVSLAFFGVSFFFLCVHIAS